MDNGRYILSFTGASLAITESIILAKEYLGLGDWHSVENIVKSENLIRARTKSSIQRVYQELAPRLQGLSQEQLELLVESNIQEQKQILWFAICKRYAFICEFAAEVLHEKFLRFDYQLTEFDYDAFFNRKADWHLELDQLAETSRKKMKTRLFWMLQEADLIAKDGTILPAILSTRLQSVLAPDAPMSYQIFPTRIS